MARTKTIEVVTDIDLCIVYHLINKIPLNLCYIMIHYMIDQSYSIKQKVVVLPYGMHLTPIFRAAKIDLDKEKGQATFMRFTAKTISQLRITSTNMPIPPKSESVKKPTDKEVQKTTKKHKIEKVEKLLEKVAGEGSHKANSPPANELFALVAERARKLIDDSSQEFEAMLAGKAVKNVADHHQKVDASLNQVVEEPSGVLRVEENTKPPAQNVDEETREVAEFLVSDSFGSKNQQKEADEEVQPEHENVGAQADFDLNVEDFPTDFNEEVFQDAQAEIENIQQENFVLENQFGQENADQNVQGNLDQNVLETVARNFQTEPIELLSADPNPMASGSLPSMEVHLLAQPMPSEEPAQNVNVSTSTMGSAAGVSQFLVSPLLTPNTIPLSPPPIINKTTKKLPDIHDLFESLDTFVSGEGPSKEKLEVSDSVKKHSKAEKMVARALRVSTKTHKIVCGLAKWTMEDHALGLAIAPPVFDDPSVFESEPSSDYGDSTP